MAESFNRMVGELEASRRQIEGYSRNLEGMVEARTGELRASQASLLALKNHLATVIANVGTGVLSLDEDGRIETFNERASEILGLAPEGARGRTLEEALGGAATARIVEVVSAVRDGREEWNEAQVMCDLPQGRRTLAVAASALRGEGQRPIGTVVVIEDLTEILATQRLTAWKEAVERVIHEIKNPLTPVGLAAETLKTAWGRDPARFADLFPSAIDMILGAVRDLKELIGEFSHFSRLPAMQPERLDPNAIVLDALSPYSQAPIGRVKVRVDLAPDVPEIEVDAVQLKRVLLNVINNALEAMAERGGELRLRTAREDGGVAIRVDDDGPGVEDVERIFEPHYTTKVKGLGLGLAIARQIVEEHGGTIRAESVPGKGTSVRIHLPGLARAGAGGRDAPRVVGPVRQARSLAASGPRGGPIRPIELVSNRVRLWRLLVSGARGESPVRERQGSPRSGRSVYVTRGITGLAAGHGLEDAGLRVQSVLGAPPPNPGAAMRRLWRGRPGPTWPRRSPRPGPPGGCAPRPRSRPGAPPPRPRAR